MSTEPSRADAVPATGKVIQGAAAAAVLRCAARCALCHQLYTALLGQAHPEGVVRDKEAHKRHLVPALRHLAWHAANRDTYAASLVLGHLHALDHKDAMAVVVNAGSRFVSKAACSARSRTAVPGWAH